MWELVKAGGWLMLPLVLCSIFMLAISIERLIRLKKNAVLPLTLLMGPSQNTAQVMQKMNQSAALKQSTLGRVFTAGYASKQQGEQYARAQMEVVASQEIGYLEKNINFLGTLSAVAPLLGLLGTVLGIIESFLMIDVGTGSDPVSDDAGYFQGFNYHGSRYVDCNSCTVCAPLFSASCSGICG